MWVRRTIPVLSLLLLPSLALAYIDPGILGAIYQLGYVFFFAAITALILRPWAFLKSMVAKLFHRKESNHGNTEFTERQN